MSLYTTQAPAVNSNGELIVVAGTGNSIPVGNLPNDNLPCDQYGRLVMALPASSGTPYNPANVQISGGQIALTGMLWESAQDAIIAHPGGGQASATQISTQTARITVVATPGDSIKLPVSAAGLEVFVINRGANPMQVFGNGTDTIDNLATAVGVSHMPNSCVIYSCTTAGQWDTNGIGTGYAGSFPTVSSQNGLTTFVGGGQAGATQITACISRFTTVATANDSAKLPVSSAGMQITVNNASANSMNLFPNIGEAINGQAVNVPFAIAAGKSASISCAVAGQWHVVLSA